jgi:copper chaperone CopZ
MKTISKIAIFVFTVILINTFVQAQSNTTISFGVSGNCEMCKKTIETSLKVKGVQSAVWNPKTKIIEVTFNPNIIKEQKLHQLIAESGYETDKLKADEDAYQALPECCLYIRKKK